ncbi:outer membrane lipoprotein carrier protein LolA [Aquibacillus sp. 3ASR75-11]|uniref:Outer membrane lipoprotein carrier protein LolA n=1 Tax=Terrihalobacillus insolitus TaxID=2950438 RepID=A0A9X3WXL2_9BACI|nr:outer membrane lipoprotein carrier protein LolA [Terrihalobacillus insolitus]MDC3415227.1 outer membrane lipoprotein carrier protein LolA [Terrihalobacillus insolitus]MDC3426378.1 outer membrane lipoprotein carrier protein LolA [Terrihalobacillus insolitus]
MRKYLGLCILALLVVVLSACGEQSKEEVVKELDSKLENMEGYKAQASMNLKTGEKSQTYNIDIWHKKKNYYRVLLKNDNDEKGNQVILRNDDGVFVLTPALNKSFKFKSDWPDNTSQPYLYQSLVKDIKNDSEATFKSTEKYYVFETKTNYQNNNNLPFQEIYFDKKTYTPVKVKVLDKEKNSLVEVNFSKFKLNPEFAKDDFQIEKNMTSGVTGVPTMAEDQPTNFSVLYPMNELNAELVETKEVELEDGKRVILSYEGEKNFTLMQERVESYPASAPTTVKGEPINLGFTVGAITSNSIEWNYNGTNFYLASEDLTREEMIDVASSVQGKEVK